MLQAYPGDRHHIHFLTGKEALVMKKLSELMKEFYESFSRREG